MNQFTKAVKSLAAKYNETSLILRIAIGLLIGAALALICPGAVWLEEFGSLFVGALKGIAPVLVFVIVAVHWHRVHPSWTAASAPLSGCIC